MVKVRNTDIDQSSESLETSESKARKPRKKVYERQDETALPESLIKKFKEDNYELRLKRWSTHGDEDYQYLTQCENEGYEFVTADELPEAFLLGTRTIDTKGRKGLVIIGDVCLMKIDCDLNKSRNKYFQDKTDAQVDAVGIHVLEKKGFRNLGTKSRVSLKEPSFQE